MTTKIVKHYSEVCLEDLEEDMYTYAEMDADKKTVTFYLFDNEEEEDLFLLGLDGLELI